MSGWHTVTQGDCVYSLAAEHRLTPERILNHADNQDLFRTREPHQLHPGDRIFIPEREEREEDRATEQKHRFVHKRPMIELRVEIHDMGRPRAGEPYWVEVGKKRYDGKQPKTDDNGLVQCLLPATTKTAIIVIGEHEDEYEVHFGHVCPAETPEGVHARLQNLDLDDGDMARTPDGGTWEGARDALPDDDVPVLEAGREEKWLSDIGPKIADEYGS